jgi:hypothetical protein
MSIYIVRLDTTLPIVPNYLGHTTAHDNFLTADMAKCYFASGFNVTG